MSHAGSREGTPRAALVGGLWLHAESGAYSPVINPATAEEIATVTSCGAAEAARSIEAACAAQQSWGASSPYERARILQRTANLLTERREALATLLTAEQGKPLREAEREIGYGASYFEWFAEEAKRVYGEIIPSSSSTRLEVNYVPIGVCAAITPWNFPHAMLARKMAAAFAAGCTMIAKPAPETPLSALELARALYDAGLPAGVLSLIPGDAEEIARVLMASAEVRKISFTGSTEVGQLLMSQSATTIKRLTLELGGNAPCIIFEDAALEQALQQAIFGKYRNAGQTCISINRFLLQRAIAAKFIEPFTARSRALRVGNGAVPETEIGPLINAAAKEKVNSLLDDALSKGATLHLGGLDRSHGLFFTPTVISGVTRAMRVWHEEIFGPVAVIAEFDTEQEAISLANDTHYGLAAYLFTADLARARRVSDALQYGMVGINETAISYAQAPFGGIKRSGFGREGSHHGIEEYLSTKYLAIGA